MLCPRPARQDDEVPAEDAPITNGSPFARAENVNHPPAHFSDRLEPEARYPFGFSGSFPTPVVILADARPSLASLEYDIRLLQVQVATMSHALALLLEAQNKQN